MAPAAFPLLAGRTDIAVVGGAELQQVLVARGLAARGYQVSMVCLDYGQEDLADIAGVTVHRAYRPGAGIPVVRFIWPRLSSIWRCLQRADADIYYQRAGGMLTGIVAEYCRRHGRKSIFAAAGALMIPYKRDEWLYEYGVRNVDRVLVQNPQQEAQFMEQFGRQSTLVPNCYPRPSGRRESAPQEVLWVSTIRAIKRPGAFLDLAEALPGRWFRMIGGRDDRESDLYEAVSRRAAALQNVEFMGFQPLESVEGHFDRAAVFVNTSESEGFPNTFLQAWSRGVPTVSFVDSGARIKGRSPGRVVVTPQELEFVVSEWTGDNSERAREGQICRDYFEGNHSIEAVLDHYERIFGELLRS